VIGGVSVDDTFLPKDLWDGYKYFHMGHIYQDEGMIEAFNASKLGLQVKNQMKEGARCKDIRKVFREQYVIFQAQVVKEFGTKWKWMKTMIGAFENEQEFAKTPFGNHTMQDAENEEDDDEGADWELVVRKAE
ncbi:hypothetical protein CYMTET_36725, partial [Cymbomonas tetramitiformis]